MTDVHEPIRIAWCIDNMQVGGTELNAVRTAELLDRDRFDLRVFCMQDHGPLLERYAKARIPVHPLPLRSLYGTSAVVAGRELVRQLRRHRAEVLHTHDVYSNVFGIPWARVAGTRTLASRRWWEGMPGLHWRAATRVGYSLAHAVLANSPGVARLLTEQERVPADRIRVIPNFLDASMFEPAGPATAELRAALGLPAGVPVIGVVANLLPIKNHGLLLRAAARLLAAGVPVHVVFAGDGPERGRLGELAESQGLGARVTFAGRLPNKPNLHHLFEISVLCSDSEGLPNSVLEAMAARKPVVSTRVGAIADVVQDGVTGLLVDPGDDAALADALQRLIGNPDEAARLGAAGHAWAVAAHSPSAALVPLQNLYEILARRPRQAGRRQLRAAVTPAGN